MGPSVASLLLLGLVFHLVFIGSVFDCYFTSPVHHGMRSYGLQRPEAKRLMLIVGDGLRADLLYHKNGFGGLYNATDVVAPYLRKVIETRGAFGVSHTRVPTESRPGHVAIIGGMYEDVSAVTKGWKTNPVDFDSVFNRSSVTFSFGSPDILPMFARGAEPGRVHTWSYDEEDENFTKDATTLDTWVLDQLKTLLHNATQNPELDAHLRGDKVVFFLHLLGLDTTGHSYRPLSREYAHNIAVVDSIVREAEALLDDFYGHDGETAFVFTADHGMSVIGNHGDGNPDSTRTPLIMWGKGVRGPLPDSTPSSHDAYSLPWELGHLYRRDIEQADIAPLMSTLLGAEWPVNSVGILPEVDALRPGFLQLREGEKTLAEAALINAKKSHTLWFKEFSPLESLVTDVSVVEDTSLPIQVPFRDWLLHRIQALIDAGADFEGRAGANVEGRAGEYIAERAEEHIDTDDAQTSAYTEARASAAELIQLTLEGLRYLHTYERFLIRTLAVFAYTGWAALMTLYIFPSATDVGKATAATNSSTAPTASRSTGALEAVFGALLVGFFAFFAAQHSPWTYYLYVSFPVYFWYTFARDGRPVLRRLGTEAKARPGNLVWHTCLVGGSLMAMVTAYTQRYIWTVGYLVIGLLWPATSWSATARSKMGYAAVLWPLVCLASAVFPMLSVDKTESLGMILAGGACILTTSYVVYRARVEATASLRPKQVFVLQALLIALSMLVTASSVRSLQAKLGLPLVNQVVGWIILVLSTLTPFVALVKHANPDSKILMYFMGFGTCFVLLSISVEGLFYVAYTATLGVWVEVEAALRDASGEMTSSSGAKALSPGVDKSSSPGARRACSSDATSTTPNEVVKSRSSFVVDDLRIALFFVFFVQVGFFGTGNVASISSFYLAPVYRLIPVFSPFFMAALLIFKIVVPYVMLAMTFAVLNHRLNLPPFSLFVVALALTDGMTLAFFFNVSDTGSWLEIGQTISFFCITSLLLLWSAGICAAGEYLMADTFVGLVVDKSI
ncbi:PigN-domain-containing protein [Schizophyllum commune Loenen D]|nr:PigN-domain-containing protein [Schizophyllum commune Loenen D]